VFNNNRIFKAIGEKMGKNKLTMKQLAIKFLLDNDCDDLVLNKREWNKGNYKYVSDIMVAFLKFVLKINRKKVLKFIKKYKKK